MVSSRRGRHLCLAASAARCSGFRVGDVRVGASAIRPSSGTARMSDVERRSDVLEETWTSSEALPRPADPRTTLSLSFPETIAAAADPTAGTVESAAAAAAAASAAAAATAAAVLDADARPLTGSTSATEELLSRRKKRRAGKAPEVVVEGDLLANTPKMVGLVWSSLALNALYLLQALFTVTSPLEALWTAVGAFVGYMIADLVSGVFHWSVDNYGDGRTPVFGAVIEAFQGHHSSPWTITYRPFENNVHKIAYAVLPLLALLRLVNPGPAGVALGVTFLVGSLMSNEFHRFAHMTSPPAFVSGLQRLGLAVSRKEHGRHHSSPFEEKYCIVTGICNGPLDHFRVFRFMERVVHELTGVEPIAWKLDPSVKDVSLSTGWLPFSGAAARVDDTAS